MESSKTQLVKNTRMDKVTVYWVSYLDRLQRVLLFTQDERVAKKVRKVSIVECFTLAKVSNDTINVVFRAALSFKATPKLFT